MVWALFLFLVFCQNNPWGYEWQDKGSVLDDGRQKKWQVNIKEMDHVWTMKMPKVNTQQDEEKGWLVSAELGVPMTKEVIMKVMDYDA